MIRGQHSRSYRVKCDNNIYKQTSRLTSFEPQTFKLFTPFWKPFWYGQALIFTYMKTNAYRSPIITQ